MAIVMGLDQHRAQITAEWIDTDTGELGRARDLAGAPRRRAPVLQALRRSEPLEVALEATTGWRFVVEELHAIGAAAHLAEPAETAARRGNKKRAKTDRADARHLRELLMIGRLPESWIPPEHLLDLRARVRLRHTLVDQRGEWQQRIQAVLYHHGFPQRNGLLTAENRAWLEGLALPASAREQITVALKMIDSLDAQSAPITRELRLYARRQHGCRALMKHYGIGELTAVTILAELGDARRFSSSRHAVRYAGLDITVHSPTSAAPPGTSRARDRRRCAGRCSKPPRRRAGPAAPTAAITTRPPSVSAATAPASRSPASCSSAASTPCATSATRAWRPPEKSSVRALPSVTPMHRGRLPACSCRHDRVDGLQRPSGRTASRGNTPSTITSPARRTARPRTEIRPGARAHRTPPLHRAHSPPKHRRITTTNTIARLTRNAGTDKEHSPTGTPQCRCESKAPTTAGIELGATRRP